MDWSADTRARAPGRLGRHMLHVVLSSVAVSGEGLCNSPVDLSISRAEKISERPEARAPHRHHRFKMLFYVASNWLHPHWNPRHLECSFECPICTLSYSICCITSRRTEVPINLSLQIPAALVTNFTRSLVHFLHFQLMKLMWVNLSPVTPVTIS